MCNDLQIHLFNYIKKAYNKQMFVINLYHPMLKCHCDLDL